MFQFSENEINVPFQTEPFDSTVWDVVQAASQMDLRTKLHEAVQNRDWEDIDIIFQNITHQMTFYSATYVVLPHMVRFLEQVMEEGDVEHAHLLIFNLGICLATDIEGNHFEETNSPLLEDYNAAAQKLAGLTKRFLNTYIDEIQEMDEEQRSMLFVAVLAILGERETVYVALEQVASGELDEISMVCGGDCDYYEECYEPYEQPEDGIVPAEKYVSGKWDRKSYNDAFLWTSAVADMLDLENQLEVLRYLYGTFTCPECGKTKRVIDFMVTYFREG
ncbi:MAG: hypothetical protein K2N90_10620 [Lachnospiraceae bacterium]|nr:hypothetical protein [Lachnospiraceae bacterium]